MDNENVESNIFDAQGYRYNVGIILLNHRQEVFWGKRRGQDAWQFPQGGINAGESSLQAMQRELYEETGLQLPQVEVIGETGMWLRYRLPVRFRRRRRPGMVQCIGQKQKWFLLRLIDENVCFDFSAAGAPPEFDDWRWIGYWQPADEVVHFKRKVYQQALNELAGLIPGLDQPNPPQPQGKMRSYSRKKR